MDAHERVPIGEVCTVVGGGTPRRGNPDYFGGPVPWATPTDVTALDTLFIQQTTETITEVGLRESSARLVPAGSVLMTSRATIGHTAIASVPMATNQGFANLICTSRIQPEYLAFWLRYRRDALIQMAGGTTFKELPKSTLKKVRIPLPPLEEQRRIVDILKRAAKIERLRAKAAERLGEFVPALFIKMFGDPVTNPMGWESQTLGELAVLGPQYGANAKAVALAAGKPRYVRITDIQAGGDLSAEPVGIDADRWERYRLIDGDLLFARSGATVGKAYLHRREHGLCVFAGYLIRFRLAEERLHPLVAFAFTQTSCYSDWVRQRRRTAAQPNINGREYASLELPVPDRELQHRFVDMLNQATAVEALGKRSSRDAADLSASLLDSLLDDAE